jgi:uncharacterized LabA/DUF88 family protein
MPAALFVDLPNFYSNLIRSNQLADRTELKNYFLTWLDWSSVASQLTASFSGVWIFYSRNGLGPRGERLTGKELSEYIERINRQMGVTARNAGITEKYKETAAYTCKKCGAKGWTYAGTEKGVDAALIVHLYDTMGAWSEAFVLSADSDFTPAVASLRRRGKIIVGAGFPSFTSPALVRECYSYVDLIDAFLGEDVALYSLLRQDGLAQEWLMSGTLYEAARYGSQPLKIDVAATLGSQAVTIELSNTLGISAGEMNNQVDAFRARYASHVRVQQVGNSFKFEFSSSTWSRVVERLNELHGEMPGLEGRRERDTIGLRRHYQVLRRENHYQPVLDDGKS